MIRTRMTGYALAYQGLSVGVTGGAAQALLAAIDAYASACEAEALDAMRGRLERCQKEAAHNVQMDNRQRWEAKAWGEAAKLVGIYASRAAEARKSQSAPPRVVYVPEESAESACAVIVDRGAWLQEAPPKDADPKLLAPGQEWYAVELRARRMEGEP